MYEIQRTVTSGGNRLAKGITAGAVQRCLELYCSPTFSPILLCSYLSLQDLIFFIIYIKFGFIL